MNVHEAETKFVHQSGRKKMGFREVEEACMDRSIEGEIQRRGADAAGERASQRFLQVTAAERKQTFRIGKEEPRR